MKQPSWRENMTRKIENVPEKKKKKDFEIKLKTLKEHLSFERNSFSNSNFVSPSSIKNR